MLYFIAALLFLACLAVFTYTAFKLVSNPPQEPHR